MIQSSKLNGEGVMPVVEIRRRLGYKSRETMAFCWRSIFPEEFLPDDHGLVPLEKIRFFLSKLSQTQKGRRRSIKVAAKAFLSELDGKPVPNFELLSNNGTAHNSKLADLEEAPPTSSKVGKVSKPAPETPWQDIFKLLSSFVYRLLRSAIEFIISAGPLEIVFLVGIALADYSLYFFMREIGLAWATVYTLITIHALQMAKNPHSRQTASKGVVAVFVLEVVSFFIDLAMFNLKIWQAGKRGELPFSVWENVTYPFWVSFALASLFCGGVLYALSITLSLTSERIKAQNFEASYGLKW